MIAGGIVEKLRFENRARFNFYVKSNSKFLITIKIEALVHEGDLQPNLLLGSDFCDTHGVMINYPRRMVTGFYSTIPLHSRQSL